MNTFYAVDFDRTLGSVENQTTQLRSFLEKRGLRWTDELTTQIDEAHVAGKSFDVISYVHSTHPEIDVKALRQEYMAYAAAHQAELVLPGAGEFIAWLSYHALPYGIVSYGKHAWQDFKIEAAGFRALPHLIVSTREKAKLFATWQQGDVFHIPDELGGGSYDEIVLVDDRLGAFDGKPNGMRGYWVVGEQIGEAPVGVTRVTSIQEVSGLEEAFLAKS